MFMNKICRPNWHFGALATYTSFKNALLSPHVQSFIFLFSILKNVFCSTSITRVKKANMQFIIVSNFHLYFLGDTHVLSVQIWESFEPFRAAHLQWAGSDEEALLWDPQSTLQPGPGWIWIRRWFRMTVGVVAPGEPPAHLCTPRTQSSAQQCWVLDYWQAQAKFPSCIMGHASVTRRQT